MDKIEYESVYILKPILSKKEINKIIERICALIDEKGKTLRIENIGMKNLAYKIREFNQGYYLIMVFSVSSEESTNVIRKIENKLRTIEEIIKFIIIRKDD